MHCPGRTAGGRPRTWGTAEGAGAIWVSQGGWAVAAARLLGGPNGGWTRRTDQHADPDPKADGDEQLVIVPENKTVEFYNYLRGYGFSFTIDCRGFCEDNIFCFPETENSDRLRIIVSRFAAN